MKRIVSIPMYHQLSNSGLMLLTSMSWAVELPVIRQGFLDTTQLSLEDSLLVTRSRRVDRRGQWLRLLLAWMLISSLAAGSQAAVVLTEYEAKAGFLYHVGWFVEWPATTIQASAPIFIIGVLGTDPFGGVLNDVMGGKSIHERPVALKYYQRVEEAVSSHILFISASEEPRLPAILTVLGKTSVLTISDMERFTERGGMMALRLVDQKVHFDINMDATESVGLKLSSQLLRLAKVIQGSQRPQE